MFGPKGVVRTPGRGRFRCPHCGVPRAYTLRRVRRFFVVFFIPVVPLRGEHTYVQCGFCRRAYRDSVLESAGLARDVEADVLDGPAEVPDEALAGAPASTLLTWDGEADR